MVNLRGQVCVLQSSCAVDSPSHIPPLISSFFLVRVFVRLPPPQVLEHVPICQLFHSQFSGTSKYKLHINKCAINLNSKHQHYSVCMCVAIFTHFFRYYKQKVEKLNRFHLYKPSAEKVQDIDYKCSVLHQPRTRFPNIQLYLYKEIYILPKTPPCQDLFDYPIHTNSGHRLWYKLVEEIYKISRSTNLFKVLIDT